MGRQHGRRHAVGRSPTRRYHVFNLRNQRTAGELSRQEGGKVFGGRSQHGGDLPWHQDRSTAGHAVSFTATSAVPDREEGCGSSATAAVRWNGRQSRLTVTGQPTATTRSARGRLSSATKCSWRDTCLRELFARLEDQPGLRGVTTFVLGPTSDARSTTTRVDRISGSAEGTLKTPPVDALGPPWTRPVRTGTASTAAKVYGQNSHRFAREYGQHVPTIYEIPRPQPTAQQLYYSFRRCFPTPGARNVRTTWLAWAQTSPFSCLMLNAIDLAFWGLKQRSKNSSRAGPAEAEPRDGELGQSTPK